MLQRGCGMRNLVTGARSEFAASHRATAADGQALRGSIHESRHSSWQAQIDVEHDAVLRMAALKLLGQSPFIAIRAIRCEVQDGVLTLRGSVASFYLKQVALSVVRELKQVRAIHNDVEVGVAPSRACLWVDKESASGV
jgi:osmotically-inducible protein OsmY